MSNPPLNTDLSAVVWDEMEMYGDDDDDDDDEEADLSDAMPS